MKSLLFHSYFLFFGFIVYSQTYSGRVVDAENHQQAVPFAKIHFVDLGNTLIANDAGYWHISNIPGEFHHIIIQSSGYKTTHIDVELLKGDTILIPIHPSHYELDKVVVSNDGILHRESITNVSSHSMSEINKIPTTLGESLTQIPGIYQTGIGRGISQPVVRGLSRSSVVSYVNNIRIQSQQWGSDHGLPVTSLGIGSVEIIKGPAALLFGSDALGGVVYFVDEPFLEKNHWGIEANSRFESVSLGTVNQLGIKVSHDKFKINLYAGYNNHADYSVPGGQQVLNSRYNQTSGKMTAGYTLNKGSVLFRYNYYQGRLGLPGHTHDSVPTLSSFLTTNQHRDDNVPAQKALNHMASLEGKWFLAKNEFTLSLAHTYNSIKEHEEKFFFPDIIMTLNSSQLNFKWKTRFSQQLELVSGIQSIYQDHQNGQNAPEILIPNNQTLDAGIYSLIRFSKNEWRAMIGGRVDQRLLTISDENFNTSYYAYNFSGGVSKSNQHVTWRINLASGYRPPNVSELLADGIHHGSFRYEIGDTELQPEKSLQGDASLSLHFDDIELLINPFYNWMSNYIYLEQVDSVIDNFKVYRYTQVDRAQLTGLDLSLHFHPHFAHWIHFQHSLSTVFAEDQFKNPIPMIPQSRISSEIIFEFETKEKFHFENMTIQHQYLFKQNRLGILETETAGFHLLNIGLNASGGENSPFRFSIGARNLLNTTTIDHLSGLKYLGIPNPGISFYGSVQYRLNHLNQ